jgi:hypothetical protein
MKQSHLNARQTHWIEQLQEYDFDIGYIPGKTNKVADALSRMTVNAVSSGLGVSEHQLESVKCAYRSDPFFREAFIKLSKGEQPDPPQHTYQLNDGFLYWNGRLCIPQHPLRKQLLESEHRNGHLGFSKIYPRIARLFFWPKMGMDLEKLIKSCDSCQRNKAVNQAPVGVTQPIPTPDKAWEVVTMDFITGLPRTRRGHDAIAVFVDKLTKRAHFAATRKALTAEEFAVLFIDTVFKQHGMPRVFISDRDRLFTSTFWRCFTKAVGTTLAMSSSYHPQTDGQTERLNRTLEEMLRSYTRGNNDWDTGLALAEFAYNNSVQCSTGFTPFELDGVQAATPATLWNPQQVPQQSFIADASIKIQAAKDHLHAAQQRQARYRNEGRRNVEFHEGQWVLVQSTRFARTQLDPEGHGKLKSRFIGPFRILERIGPVTYRLELPPDCRVHNAFHVELLRPYVFEGLPAPSPHLMDVLKELRRLQEEYSAETAQSEGGECNIAPYRLGEDLESLFEKS